MNPLSSVKGPLALAILFGVQLRAAELTTNFFSVSGSKVIVEGTSKLHDWRVEGDAINGTVQCDYAFPEMASQQAKPGQLQASMEGFVPVRSLHSITEGASMDAFICARLREETSSRIYFRFSDVRSKAASASPADPYLFDSRCELVVAGITNQVSIPLGVLVLSGNKLKITGNMSIKFSDFHIETSGGATWFKWADEAAVRFEWIVGRKPNG